MKKKHHRPNHNHPVIAFLLKTSHFFHWSFHVLLPDFISKVPSAKLNRLLFLKTRYFSKMRTLVIGWLIMSISILSVTGYQFAKAPIIKAANTTFPFDLAGNYTFDTDRIAIGSSLATLPSVDQIDDDNTATGFAGGTFSDTAFSGGFLQLDATGLTNTTGLFTSRVIDAGGDVAWSSVDWTPQRPYQKDLPDSGSAETAYTAGNIDMNGNLALLHADETAGATTILDSSGNANNFSCTTCPASGGTGRFNTTLEFNGGETLEDADGETYLNGLTAFSLGFWVKSDVVGTDRGFFIGTAPSGSDDGLTIRYDDAGANGGGNDVIKAGITTTTGTTQVESSTNIQTTDWQHIVLTWTSGSALSLYVNGQLDTPTSAGATVGGAISTLDRAILGRGGKDTAAGAGWLGLIDEFSVFDRALAPAEISDHYLRGATRLGIQVRSCDDAICDIEPFIGPDGTASTFYGEGLNTTNALPSTTTLSSIVNNRYFQYQIVLDSDDSITTPQSSSFSFAPSHLDAGGPTIQNATGITYQTIDGFVETLGGGNTGTTRYQVSNNGTNFYYFNGLNWVTALSAAQSNPAGVINSNATTIATDIGTGDFFFRAFLNSALGQQIVELDEIEVIFDTSSNNNGGGGSSLLFFSQPVPPTNGFALTINEEATVTESPLVSLGFNAGSDISLVEISNEPNFLESITLTYSNPLSWNLCSSKGEAQTECIDGEYTVYAKFYKSFGQAPSVVVQDTIALLSLENIDAIDKNTEEENPTEEKLSPIEIPEDNTPPTEEPLIVDAENQEENETILSPPSEIVEQEQKKEQELLQPESTQEKELNLPTSPQTPSEQPSQPIPQKTQTLPQTQVVQQVSQEIGTSNFLISTTLPAGFDENESFVISFTSGALAGQSVLIDKYVANDQGILLFTELKTSPTIGDLFQLFSGRFYEEKTFVSPQLPPSSPVIIQYDSFTDQRSFFWFLFGLLIVTITGFGLLVLVLFRLWKQNTTLTTLIEAEHKELFMKKRKRK